MRITVLFTVVLVCILTSVHSVFSQEEEPPKPSPLTLDYVNRAIENLEQRITNLESVLANVSRDMAMKQQLDELKQELADLKRELEGPKGATLARVQAAAEKAQREANWASWIVVIFLTIAFLILAVYGYVAWRGRNETVKAAGEAKEYAANAKSIVEKQIPDFIESKKKDIGGFIERARRQIRDFTKEREGEIRSLVRDE